MIRRKTEDYIGTHEVNASPPFTKRFRVRIYESETETDLPVVVITSYSPPHAITPDIERVAAEIVMENFSEMATNARRAEKYFHLIEHTPPIGSQSTDQFAAVDFDDYRIWVRHDRPTFGSPSWRDVTRAEVIGMTLDDTLDDVAPPEEIEGA